MTTSIDKSTIREAYNDVRNDSSETNWLVMKKENKEINLDCTGENYEEFVSQFTDDIVAFGFVRIFTGDELSKRAKFALISWIGHSVSPLTKAKTSTDKALVKEVVNNYAAELLVEDKDELSEEHIRELLVKAGGANYGTGS